MTQAKTTYPCPCCGYRTFPAPPAGTYEICPVCNWEDDPVQLKDPDYKGGANVVSLREAQRNFQKYAASDLACRGNTRPPRLEEARDSGWKFLL